MSDVANADFVIPDLNITGPDLRSKQIVKLAKFLCTDRKVKKLEFSGDDADGTGGLALAEALLRNKSLTELRISSMNIRTDAGIAFAKALEKNTTLEVLKLDDNNLGLEAGLAFANTLETNTTLRVLDLRRNNIGPEAGLALAQALRTNKTLEMLGINDNPLGDKAHQAFTKMLEVNKGLKTLYITIYDTFVDRFNEKVKARISDFVKALEVNITLTSIEIGAIGGAYEEWYRSPIYISRNKAIEPILKGIRALSPPVAIESKEGKESKETKESKEGAEEFNQKQYQAVLDGIKKLSETQCSPSIIQDLQDEATIASCSWDNFQTLEARITTLEQVVTREEIVKRDSSVKTKALTCLAHVYLTQGMELFTKQKAMAEKYFMLAFTASVHGEDQESVCFALSLYFDKMDTEENSQRLLSALAKEQPKRFQTLMSDYLKQCEVFKLIPHSFDLGISTKTSETAAKPLVFSKDSPGDSKSQAEAPCGDSKSSAEAASQLSGFSGQSSDKQRTDKSSESADHNDPLSLDFEETVTRRF